MTTRNAGKVSLTKRPPPESFGATWAASGWLALPIAVCGVVLATVFVATDNRGATCESACPNAEAITEPTTPDTLPPLRDELSANQFAAEIAAELASARDAQPSLINADEPRPCSDPASCPEVDSCQISAQISDENGVPTDAHLALSRVDHLGRIATWNAVTDSAGAHRFSDLPRGTYHLTVDVAGAALQAGPPYECNGDGARAYFQLIAAQTFVPFEGRLLGHGAKVPKGASVLIEQPNAAVASMLGVAHVDVDEAGRFTSRLAPGRYRLVARAPHHQAQFRDFTVSEDDTVARLKMKLTWRPEASGVVVNASGTPVANAKVFLGPIFSPKVGYTAVVTDAEGRFTMPLIPGQTHTLAARTDDGFGVVKLRATAKTAGHQDVQIQLGTGRTVGGLVLRGNGQPHVLGEVRYRVKSLGIQDVVKTDEEGKFVIRHAPQDDVEMWAEGSAIGAWGGAVATTERAAVLLRYQKPAYK